MRIRPDQGFHDNGACHPSIYTGITHSRDTDNHEAATVGGWDRDEPLLLG